MARVRIELDAGVVDKLKVMLAGLASDVTRVDREVVDKLMEALGKAEAVEEKSCAEKPAEEKLAEAGAAVEEKPAE